jgi:ATP-binding protein involved in chromosome partitioning
MALNKQIIDTILAGINTPYTQTDLISTGSVKSVDINTEQGHVNVDIQLGYPCDGFKKELLSLIKQSLEDISEINQATVTVNSKIVAHAVQKDLKPIQNIKNVIAIASGKGGVGKSTTAVNLALALASDGARVGILDADIYGPSQPRMLGLSGPPQSPDNKHMQPKEAYGIQTMSIGYLIEEDTPMIWRGPMVTSALQQMCDDTLWDNLDYLIVDLPPGTGDIQLTLCQKIPVSAAVIITTPQDIALLDAIKGLKMFEKVDVPVLGIIENMSVHVCRECGHQEPIFGEGGGEVMAQKYNSTFLGALPLDIRIREDADKGHPTVVANPDGTVASSYREIARHTAALLSLRPKDYSGKFPKIVIENK